MRRRLRDFLCWLGIHGPVEPDPNWGPFLPLWHCQWCGIEIWNTEDEH